MRVLPFVFVWVLCNYDAGCTMMRKAHECLLTYIDTGPQLFSFIPVLGVGEV